MGGAAESDDFIQFRDYTRTAKTYEDAAKNLDSAARRAERAGDARLASAYRREAQQLEETADYFHREGSSFGRRLSGAERLRADREAVPRFSDVRQLTDTKMGAARRSLGRPADGSGDRRPEREQDRSHEDRQKRTKAHKPRKPPRGGARGGLYGLAGEAFVLLLSDYLETRAEAREDAQQLADFFEALGFEVEVHGSRLEIEAGRLRPGTRFSTTATTSNGNRYAVNLYVDEGRNVRGYVTYLDPGRYAETSAPERSETSGQPQQRYAVASVESNGPPMRTPPRERTAELIVPLAYA